MGKDLKILIKGETPEETIFEKSGLTTTFTINTLKDQLDKLSEHKAQKEAELAKVVVMMDKLVKDNKLKVKDVPDMGDKWDLFIAYVNSNNQYNQLIKDIMKLELENEGFKETYEGLDDVMKSSVAKYISYNEYMKEIEEDIVINDKAKEEYLSEVKEAELCLKTLQK